MEARQAMLLLSFFILHFSFLIPAVAGQSNEPRYKIERDQVEKEGKAADRIYVSRRLDAQNRSRLYVTVHFKITSDGKPTTDVSEDEIVVTEDGRRVSELEVRAPRFAEGLTSVLAIDISGSMAEHGKLQEAKQAAGLFLTKLHRKAACGLILFDHKLRVQERPGTDRVRLQRSVEAAKPGGGTAYLDATAEALAMLSKAKGRRAALVMTDGVDLNSRYTLNEVIRLAKDSEVPVYTIGVGEPGRNEPVSSVLVLDCSGSMKEPANDTDEISKIGALKGAASRFVDIMRPGARTTLLPFSDELETPKPFTADKRDLKARIRQLEAGGGTYLYDATYAAIETLVASRAEGKRAVVVLTDGVDEGVNGRTGSRHRVEEVIRRAQRVGIPLHMLGLGRPGDVNEEVMRQMADQTGGTYHHASNEQALHEIFEDLSIQLHDDGIDEAVLRQLAEATEGKYYPARDISQLKFIYEGLAEELQTTYSVTFPSFRQDYDGTLRDIDISVWRKGTQVSDVLRGGYNVPGVVVPEMDARVYLGLLAVIGGLLALPAGLRRFAQRGANGSV